MLVFAREWNWVSPYCGKTPFGNEHLAFLFINSSNIEQHSTKTIKKKDLY